MIRSDFINGGFPINCHNPVICVSEDIRIYTAYNNYDLKLILDNFKIKKVLGIWPGKYDTDFFVIDPSLCTIPVPPEEFKDIDSAEKIEIFYASEIFDRIDYMLKQTVYTSKSEELLDYIKKSGKKHAIRYK